MSDIQELYVLTCRGSYTREQGDGKEQSAMIQNTSQSRTGAQDWSACLACSRPVSIPRHTSWVYKAVERHRVTSHFTQVHSATPHQVPLLSAFFSSRG